jgi:hypothetical protein
MIVSLVWIIIVCAVAALAMWALRVLAPPEPINKVAYVIIVAVAVLIIIGLAAGIFGVDLGMPKPT